MLNIKRAIACLRQLREGASRVIGWIADGSSDATKSAIGKAIDVQASRTGIIIRVDEFGRIRRINWRLSELIVRLILGSVVLPSSTGRVECRHINAAIQSVRSGATVWPVPTFSIS